jgi:hypothetical protein
VFWRVTGTLAAALVLVACDGKAVAPPVATQQDGAGSQLKPALVMMEKHFAVVTPSGDFSLVQATKEGLDFELFEVRKAGRTYVRIYLGNAADFPGKSIAVGDGRLKISVAGKKGVSVDQYLIPNAEPWPRYIHAMALEIPEEQDVANQIAAGVGPIPRRP